MYLKLRQYLCRHKDMKVIATHEFTSQNLLFCPKCEVYYILHWGIGLGYYSRTPHLKYWKYEGE